MGRTTHARSRRGGHGHNDDLIERIKVLAATPDFTEGAFNSLEYIRKRVPVLTKSDAIGLVILGGWRILLNEVHPLGVPINGEVTLLALGGSMDAVVNAQPDAALEAGLLPKVELTDDDLFAWIKRFCLGWYRSALDADKESGKWWLTTDEHSEATIDRFLLWFPLWRLKETREHRDLCWSWAGLAPSPRYRYKGNSLSVWNDENTYEPRFVRRAEALSVIRTLVDPLSWPAINAKEDLRAGAQLTGRRIRKVERFRRDLSPDVIALIVRPNPFENLFFGKDGRFRLGKFQIRDRLKSLKAAGLLPLLDDKVRIEADLPIDATPLFDSPCSTPEPSEQVSDTDAVEAVQADIAARLARSKRSSARWVILSHFLDLLDGTKLVDLAKRYGLAESSLSESHDQVRSELRKAHEVT